MAWFIMIPTSYSTTFSPTMTWTDELFSVSALNIIHDEIQISNWLHLHSAISIIRECSCLSPDNSLHIFSHLSIYITCYSKGLQYFSMFLYWNSRESLALFLFHGIKERSQTKRIEASTEHSLEKVVKQLLDLKTYLKTRLLPWGVIFNSLESKECPIHCNFFRKKKLSSYDRLFNSSLEERSLQKSPDHCMKQRMR